MNQEAAFHKQSTKARKPMLSGKYYITAGFRVSKFENFDMNGILTHDPWIASPTLSKLNYSGIAFTVSGGIYFLAVIDQLTSNISCI